MVKIRVLPANELTEEQMACWRQLHLGGAHGLDNPYFSPLFTRAVASVRRDVWVGFMEQKGEIQGIFPFQKRRGAIGRPVAGALSDYQAVICKPGVRWDAHALIRGCGLRAWDFDHLLAAQEPFIPFHTATMDSPVLDLAGGYEAYEKRRMALGGKQVKNIWRRIRMLEREQGRYRFERHVDNADVLDQLMAWKSQQSRKTGTMDVFRKQAWARDLVRRIHGIQSDEFGGLLSALYIGGELAAAHFALRSSMVWHSWFPAYNEKFKKYSPGLILLLEMAKVAASEGVRRIDLGKGDAPYKKHLSTGSVRLAEGSVEVSAAVSIQRRARRVIGRWAAARGPWGVLPRGMDRLVRRHEYKRRFE